MCFFLLFSRRHTGESQRKCRRTVEGVPTGRGGSTDGSRRRALIFLLKGPVFFYCRALIILTDGFARRAIGSANRSNGLRETRRQATRATEGGSTFPVQRSTLSCVSSQYFQEGVSTFSVRKSDYDYAYAYRKVHA